MKIKEHLIALAVLLVGIMLFCLPAFQGKVLNSHDYMSYKYISAEPTAHETSTGKTAYWSNNMFCGMPSTSYINGTEGNIFLKIIDYGDHHIPRPFFMMLCLALAFYVLMSSLKLNLAIRIAFSLAFAFCYNPILAMAGHDGKVLAVAYAAGMFGGLLYTIRGNRWLGIGFFSFFTAFLIASAHYQIIYYAFITLLMAGIAILIHSFKSGTVKKTLIDAAFLAAGGLIAILPSYRNMTLMQDYTKETMRGGQSTLTINKDKTKGEDKKKGGLDKDYAFSWSNGVGETFALLIPGLYGPTGSGGELYLNGKTASKMQEMGYPAEAAQNLPDYWGPQPFISGPVYLGAISIFLFILGLFVLKSHHKYWVLVATVFFVLLSLGKNFSSFNFLMFDTIPLFNKFRAPTMALVIPTILVTLFAGWTLNEVLFGNMDKKGLLKKLIIASGITLGILLIFGLGSSMTLDFNGAQDAQVLEQLGPEKGKQLVNAMMEDRGSFAMKDSLRSLALVLLAIAGIWLGIKNKLKASYLAIGIGLLTFLDLFMITKRYVPTQVFMDKDEYEAKFFAPRGIDNKILENPEKDLSYRVQDMSVSTYNDAKAAMFHKLVGGYSPVKMEVIQDLIDVQLSKNNKEVYNMLNTKYFIVGQPDKEQLIPNPTRCGNAWFVSNIVTTKTADEEMLALNAPSLSDSTSTGTFVAQTTAIMNDSISKKLSASSFIVDPTAVISLKEADVNNLKYESNNNNDGVAIFSEVYFKKGWTATIDDKPATILRANYLLRALAIPKGNHKIAFHFEPLNIGKLKMIASIGSALVLALLALGIFMNWKGKGKEDFSGK
jgi:Bacterial membrane protein YfhO